MDSDGLGVKSRSAARPPRRPGSRKHRGLTCDNCRSRKVRCDGSQPTCKTCEVYGDECRYEKPPSMSQVLVMAKQLQEAEQTIAELRAAISSSSLPRPNLAAQSVVVEGHDNFDTMATPKPAQNLDKSLSLDDGEDGAEGQNFSRSSTPQELLQDLSLDENGKICYYGPTSAVHDPPSIDASTPPPASSVEGLSKSEIRAQLVAKAQESRMWEDFALGVAASQSDIPRPVLTKFLHLHWTWISPMFMWVYRPAFIRDMSSGGPYYSEFLLVVMCAHAARFHDAQVSEMLISKARLLLGAAIHEPISIPTIQALLQLSARDLAMGSISHAWLYSGMAFRMARDLGLHHSTSSAPGMKNLEPIDIEVRRRLFWSCYFWDKAISLYTGRMPALTEQPDSAALEFLDDSSEEETWSPYVSDSFTLTHMAPSDYPPHKAHLVSCFANSCKLSVIINDIVLYLYRRRNTPNAETALKKITRRLENWRAGSPNHLRCDPDNLPEICPPPHIMSQNLLYYTTVILSHRPFWSVPAHYQACISAAYSIEKLLLLLEKTFGFDNITYLMAYCVYTGALPLLQEARNGNADATAKIQTLTRALQAATRRCPILERSLNIIRKGLAFSSANQQPLSPNSMSHAGFHQDASGGGGGGALDNYIPAFPYFGFSGVDEYRMDPWSPGALNIDSFSSLDCFPETHIGQQVTHSLDMGNPASDSGDRGAHQMM